MKYNALSVPNEIPKYIELSMNKEVREEGFF
jgi:hypothetical protein